MCIKLLGLKITAGPWLFSVQNGQAFLKVVGCLGKQTKITVDLQNVTHAWPSVIKFSLIMSSSGTIHCDIKFIYEPETLNFLSNA